MFYVIGYVVLGAALLIAAALVIGNNLAKKRYDALVAQLKTKAVADLSAKSGGTATATPTPPSTSPKAVQ